MYEDVLRSVRYRLAKGSARFERRFRLSCSEMNGRYTSNELTLEVRPVQIVPLLDFFFFLTLCECDPVPKQSGTHRLSFQ